MLFINNIDIPWNRSYLPSDVQEKITICKNVVSSTSLYSYIPSVNMVSIKENVTENQNNEQIDETNENKNLIKIIANTSIDEVIANFFLISSNPSVHEFKDLDHIFNSFENHVCTNEQTQEYDKECSIDEKSWIPLPNQLEEGSHMLTKNTIEININNDP